VKIGQHIAIRCDANTTPATLAIHPKNTDGGLCGHSHGFNALFLSFQYLGSWFRLAWLYLGWLYLGGAFAWGLPDRAGTGALEHQRAEHQKPSDG
jgi:hypothetical protein